jgi:hypothetical protein
MAVGCSGGIMALRRRKAVWPLWIDRKMHLSMRAKRIYCHGYILGIIVPFRTLLDKLDRLVEYIDRLESSYFQASLAG